MVIEVVIIRKSVIRAGAVNKAKNHHGVYHACAHIELQIGQPCITPSQLEAQNFPPF
jgi:hypothetical protein